MYTEEFISYVCPNCLGDLDRTHKEYTDYYCPRCSLEFLNYDGLPCFGIYDQREFCTIIELSTVQDLSTRDSRGIVHTRYEGAKHKELLDLFFNIEKQVKNKYNWRDEIKEIAPNMDKRYQDFYFARAISEGIDFSDKLVLDIGAGTGFDASLWEVLGANVIALEINPLLGTAGAQAVPSSQWLQGNVRRLPFKDNSFDIITAGNALHHVTCLPDGLAEIMRVLKPDGYFLSHSDMFASENLTIEDEIREFSKHPAVLMGVNERRPRFSEFTSIFKDWSSEESVEVYTNVIHGLLERSDRFVRLQDIYNKEKFDRSGSIFMKVKKTKICTSKRTVDKDPIKTSSFLPYIHDKYEIIMHAAQFADGKLVDTNYIFDCKKNKEILLLGWSPENTSAKILGEAYMFLTGKFPLSEFNVNLPENYKNSLHLKITINKKSWGEIFIKPAQKNLIRINIDTAPHCEEDVMVLRIGHDFKNIEDRKWFYIESLP